jgi:acyl-CoA thioester hydrolase
MAWIETHRGVVYPWQCDHMGHMNVMWYVSKFDEGTWHLFASLGLTPGFLKDNHRGMAAVEQRILYRRELHAGDTLAVRTGILEMRDKVVKFVHEMRNTERDEVSAVCVLTGVHIDTQARKACAFPGDVVARGRERLVQYDLEKR